MHYQVCHKKLVCFEAWVVKLWVISIATIDKQHCTQFHQLTLCAQYKRLWIFPLLYSSSLKFEGWLSVRLKNPFNRKLLQNVFWQLRLEGTIKLDTDTNPSSMNNFAYFENSLDFFQNLIEKNLVLIFWVSQKQPRSLNSFWAMRWEI